MKSSKDITRLMEQIHKEIQPALYETAPLETSSGHETQEDWTRKILELTATISKHYPELTKYIEEMTITIPNDKHPEISMASLRSYYDSINTMLINYINELPENRK